MSRKYDKIKTEEEFLSKCRCGWCKKTFCNKKKLTGMRGAVFDLVFGWDSDYDLFKFSFEICDNCFKKHLEKFASKEEVYW